MTIDEAKEVIEQDIPCELDADLIEALHMAIASLEAWEKVRQEIQTIKLIEMPTDGEVQVNSCKNKTGLKVKMEALAIIDRHLKEVKHDD